MSGSSTFPAKGLGQTGVYGTEGVAATSNVPGCRNSSVSWTDSSSNLWLFGGNGVDAAGTYGGLNDLWEFAPGTKKWTWIGGSSILENLEGHFGESGVYGTLGTPAPANVPGGRTGAVSWTDSQGNFWLFGGDGFASGFIYGLLNGEKPQQAINLGWAHGALMTTFPGDTTMATLDQVVAFASGGSARIQR